MEFIVVAVLIGLIPAFIAKGKGHEFWLWWLYGAALFIVALPHALLMKPARGAEAKIEGAAGNVKCPHCAEWIRAEAKVCRHCGRDLTPAVV